MQTVGRLFLFQSPAVKPEFERQTQNEQVLQPLFMLGYLAEH